MFYTKYRPQKFSEIVRPNSAVDALVKEVKEGKTAHAYLFVGSRGTGKTTTARVLAKALNCLDLAKNGDPCDKCENCVAIKTGSFIDLIEIDAASNRGIEDIRELRERVKLAPTAGKQKVYVIDEVHMLTNEAFNALLKTLEEPPKKTTFILCTTELHKVPDTIRSRCQVFKFKRATNSQLTEKLKKIVSSEKLKVSDDVLTKIAQASTGGFRDAETLLQQSAEGSIDVDTLLTAGSREDIVTFIDALYAKDKKSALEMISRVFDDGIDMSVWCGEVLKHFRDLIFIRSGVELPEDQLSEELMAQVKAQASNIQTSWLGKATTTFLNAHKLIKSSFIPQLPLELAVVDLCVDDSTEDNPVAPTKKAPTPPTVSKDKDKEKEKKDAKETKESKDTKEAKEKASVEPTAEKIVEEVVTKVMEAAEENSAVDDTPTETESVVAMSVIEEKWSEIITKSSKINNTIMALLKSGQPVRVDGKYLIIEFFYSFHKERLESPKNRKVVEDLLNDVYQADIKVKCVIGKEKPKNLKKGETGVLTDMNVVLPNGAQPVDKDTLLQAFDGALPL